MKFQGKKYNSVAMALSETFTKRPESHWDDG